MTERRKWDDQQVEVIIANLLRAGVILAALIVLGGGIFFLIRHGYDIPQYRKFQGESQAWSTLHGLFSTQTFQRSRGIIMLGLLTLILTPVARVAFSLFAFALERDWLYVGVTAIVLGLLLYSLTSA